MRQAIRASSARNTRSPRRRGCSSRGCRAAEQPCSAETEDETLTITSRLSEVRKTVSDRVGRLIDWGVEHPHPGNRLFKLSGMVAAHERRLDEQRERMDRLATLERRFREVEKAQHWSANELERIIPQIAAQESQLEALREKLAAVPAAD